MDTTFPFHLDASLSFYLIVYILTLVLHAMFMTYVLAGSAYLAWTSVFPGTTDSDRGQTPLACLLRDWMPFLLSAAITAGVAPLLFVQIIYRQQFYTANLLLGWRWMMVVPVLIVGFYLLYVLKSKQVSRWSMPLRAGVATGVAGSFLFVAFCWTTNHLLGIDHSRWPQVFASGAVGVSAVSGLRLLTWVTGAFPSMCALVVWQLARHIRHSPDTGTGQSDVRGLARMAIGGLILATLFGVGYVATLDAAIRQQLLGSAGRLWVLAVVTGVICQAGAWLRQLQTGQLSVWIQVLLFTANLLTLLGVACLRELIRLSQVDISAVTTNTRAATEVGGFGLFVLFAVFNLLLMGFCIRLVRQRR